MKDITREKILAVLMFATLLFFVYKVKDFRNPLNLATYVHVPENAVTFPTSGEKLIMGKTYTITWQGDEGRTDLFLINHAYESEGVSISIADRVYDIPNSGKLKYKVPTNIPAGEYKFTIGKLNSDYFEIEK